MPPQHVRRDKQNDKPREDRPDELLLPSVPGETAPPHAPPILTSLVYPLAGTTRAATPRR